MPAMDDPLYGVVGLGAIGGLYGSRLLRAGRRVRFLVRRAAGAIRRDGLHVTSPWGDHHEPTPEVFDDPAALGRCDRVLVALKATANPALDRILPELCHDRTTVAMFQNGLGGEDDAGRSVARERTLGALCFVCAHQRGPGVVEHLDYGSVMLGAHRGHAGDADLAGWADDLRAGGVPVERAPDITAARWAKLCWNIPYNGTSVVHACDTRELMDRPELRREVEALMAEVAAAAEACGSPLPEGHLAKMLDHTDRMVAYRPSMLLDHQAGRPLEIDAIYSRPIAAAEAAGVAMPVATRIRDRLRTLDPGAGARR